jgi:branched-subunit amino acid aminotransferase/4-amino-4-deoxychorismate lyase
MPRADALSRLHLGRELNAVRGACPVVELDGRPVGDGKPGPAALRLREVLDSAQ